MLLEECNSIEILLSKNNKTFNTFVVFGRQQFEIHLCSQRRFPSIIRNTY